jgi:hypothetical protein
VTSEGVRLDLKLTHHLLAAVTGARRPSVTTPLKRLAHEERVRPLPRSRRLLLGAYFCGAANGAQVLAPRILTACEAT